MTYIARLLRLLGITVWVGGLIFFGLVEAPTAFHVMGTTRQFAEVINSSITTLNVLGPAAGILFVIASLLLWSRLAPRSRKLILCEVALIILMILATMYVQHAIVPAMERDRASAGGDIASEPVGNPVRDEFDRLHGISEKVEGSALFIGLGVILLMAAESGGNHKLIH